jgi:hypothetical protein
MSKGKRGRKAQLRQPVKGDVQGGKMWVNQLRSTNGPPPANSARGSVATIRTVQLTSTKLSQVRRATPRGGCDD